MTANSSQRIVRLDPTRQRIGRGKRVKRSTLGVRFRESLKEKEERERRRWTHQDVADLIGCERAYISTIASMDEAPRNLNIQGVWEPLANFLEINLWWLLYERGPKQKEARDVSEAKNRLFDKLVGVSDTDADAVSQLVDAFLAGKRGRTENP